MPNWCNNTVEISHSDPAMIERVKTAFNDGRLLEEFIPVPKDLHIVAGRVGDDSDQAQKDLEAQEALNESMYGYKNWYDWCVNEWGTKWDVGADGYPAEVTPYGLTLIFDSAWAPPINAYDKLLDQGFMIRAYYNEGGMAFAGVWDNGDDQFYEYGGLTSEQIREELPETLDEMFGISECVEEWEAEREEEDSE